MLSFLLLGLIGGGPVRWLVRAGDTGIDCILGSPLRAASPTGRRQVGMNTTGKKRGKPACSLKTFLQKNFPTRGQVCIGTFNMVVR